MNRLLGEDVAGRCVLELKKRATELEQMGVAVVLIQAEPIKAQRFEAWANAQKLPFALTTLKHDHQLARQLWGVAGLPWLILTDETHTVTAEGFKVEQIDEKIKLQPSPAPTAAPPDPAELDEDILHIPDPLASAGTMPPAPPQSQPATDPAHTKPRIIHFPKDRSLGKLEVQDIGVQRHVDVHLRFGIGPDWKYLGEATGDVIVPAGKRLALQLSPHEWRDLAPLAQLRADDLYMVTLQLADGVKANDKCMPYLAQLTGLKVLGLEFTNITNRGLRFIQQMQSLEVVSLPPGITNAGLAPLTKLRSLEVLYLSGDRITDAGLSKLAQATPLKDVYLRFGPDARLACLTKLGTLPSLRYHICINHLAFNDSVPKYLENATPLVTLSLSDVPITDTGLSHLSKLSQLEVLCLYNAPITDEGLAYLASLPSLRDLNIRNRAGRETYITDSGMAHLSRIKSLESLHLPKSITDDGLAYLAELPNLKSLIAPNSRSIGDEGLRRLAKVSSLETLNFRGRGITNAGMDHIAKLTNLRHLQISGGTENPINDTGLAKLTALKSLTALRIGSPGMTVSGLSQLNALPNLISLNVAASPDGSVLNIAGLHKLESFSINLPQDPRIGICDADLACLANLTNLKRFVIAQNNRYSNPISNTGMAHLARLTLLETLWIGGREITDEGLSYVANMRNMSNLNLTGDFSDSGLRHLADLKRLNRLRITSQNPFSETATERLRANLPNIHIFQMTP